MIQRNLQNLVEKHLDDKKAIILLGPRQVGKKPYYKALQKNYQTK